MSDFDRYPEWHPFTPVVKTNKNVGSAIKQDVHMFPGRRPIKFKGKISKWKEGVHMEWTMNHWPFIWAKRIQTLDKLPDGQTRYRTEDMNAGLLNPIVRVFYSKAIYRGFRRTALALKNQSENFMK